MYPTSGGRKKGESCGKMRVERLEDLAGERAVLERVAVLCGTRPVRLEHW